jgi:uncharacterized protein YbbC (DUF1343 family)
MKKFLPFLILSLLLTMFPPGGSSANLSVIQLGSDVLFTHFHQIIEDKKVGLITNQTGINGSGVSTIDMIRRDGSVTLTALFTPEYGLNGKAPADDPLTTYVHPVYEVPVYSLAGPKPQLTAEMLQSSDLLLVDLQNLGTRHDSYLSLLHTSIAAAKEHKKPIIILDRPNPLGGMIIDGPVLEDPAYLSDVGVDTLPLTYGMTFGELALFFNRKIGADVTVIPMTGYKRSMTYQDTELDWYPPSPAFSDLSSVLSHLATSMGEGTNLQYDEKYNWIGKEGIDEYRYADLMNGSLLPGVVFFPEKRESAGGVRIQIIDPRLFNPAKTGIYALAHANKLSTLTIKPGQSGPSDFDLRMGTNKIAQLLEQGASPKDIEAAYMPQHAQFLSLRVPYLIYNEEPYYPTQPISSKQQEIPSTPAPIEEPKPSEPSPAKPALPAQPSKEQPATPAPAPVPVPVPVPAPVLPAKDPAPEKSAEPAPATPAPVPKQPPAPPAAGKVAYLTFDDGPSPVTLHILETLKSFDAKATFFVVGRNIPGNEEILKRIVAEGHSVGGHSYSHDYRYLYKSVDAFFADMEKGNQLIEQATGVKPTLFRYPGGSTNTISLKYQDPSQYNKNKTVMAAIKEESRERGLTFIDWNVTNGDARSNRYTADEALGQIKKQVNNQKEIVILMHDTATKAATAESLPEVMQFLKEKGYRFEAISPDHQTISTVK